ncbi:MAG TPA: lycopene beta-cyclase CrtY [Polyangiaceae bacterium]|nr:lycopene beta-cyclase CrtY [Polyangiaceae bacterium]
MRGFEFVLAGGGLQAGLVALALLARRTDARLAIVEEGRALGGNHTWCFHASDLPRAARSWLEPLVVKTWPACDVVFPHLRRTLRSAYCAITSARFASVVGDAIASSPRSERILGRRAVRVDAHEVALEDGTTLHAELVVDARGPAATPKHCGFQKFLGLELELAGPHGLARPTLIDATVPQHDGFRFFYVLPFEARRVLVEDTCFSRSPSMDWDVRRAAVLEYAARFGSVKRILREETGVLPMPWASDAPEPNGPPLVAGYRGGWFHPATGYSLPIAARLACYLAERPASQVFGPELARLHREHRAQARYAERLNRLLFHCFAPGDMRNVFERFYALPEDVIARFNALSTTWRDRARIVVGRPPRGFSLRGTLALAGAT